MLAEKGWQTGQWEAPVWRFYKWLQVNEPTKAAASDWVRNVTESNQNVLCGKSVRFQPEVSRVWQGLAFSPCPWVAWQVVLSSIILSRICEPRALSAQWLRGRCTRYPLPLRADSYLNSGMMGTEFYLV